MYTFSHFKGTRNVYISTTTFSDTVLGHVTYYTQTSEFWTVPVGMLKNTLVLTTVVVDVYRGKAVYTIIHILFLIIINWRGGGGKLTCGGLGVYSS